MDETVLVEEAKEAKEAKEVADKRIEVLKTDPDAVRKILSNQVTVEETVTVYPNKALNFRFEKMNSAIVELGTRLERKENSESDDDYTKRIESFRPDYDATVADFDDLKKSIAESAVTFRLVSLSRKAIKNLRTTARKNFPLPAQGEDDDPEVSEAREEWYRCAIIAAHLEQDKYTVEDIETIRDEWPTRCFVQLWLSAQKLSIADDYLAAGFNPDF